MFCIFILCTTVYLWCILCIHTVYCVFILCAVYSHGVLCSHTAYCALILCTLYSYSVLCIYTVYFVFIQCTVYLYCVRFFGCFPFQSVLGVPAVCSVGDKGRAGICLTFSRRFCPKRLTVIQIYIQYIYTYWWQWLPCKMPTSTSVAVWGSVSCPRTGERRNQSNNLSDSKTLSHRVKLVQTMLDQRLSTKHVAWITVLLPRHTCLMSSQGCWWFVFNKPLMRPSVCVHQNVCVCTCRL